MKQFTSTTSLVLAGTPTTAGAFTFAVTGNDSVGGMASQTYTVVINPPVTITSPSLANGTAGTAYSQTISATGGTGSLTFSETGTLPTGLTLSSAGVLSGTPTTARSYTFTVTATDAVGASASQSYTINISAGPFAEFNVAITGPSTVQGGNSFLVTAQAADAFGNPIYNYSGPSSVTATISPTSAASNFPQTVSINSHGLGFFLANLQKVGTYTITVGVGSPPMAPMGSAAPVTVTAGSPVKLAFLAQPAASTPTGVTLAPVTVAVEDANGNVVTSDSTDYVTVCLTTPSGAPAPGGFLAGSTTTEEVENGIATFNNLALVVPGTTYELTAIVDTVPQGGMTADYYIGPNSNSFNIAPLQVVPSSFASSPSGFSLSFNAPFHVNTNILNPNGGANVPALYGSGFGAGGIKPSITLTQETGQAPNGFKLPYQVAGSVVLNPATYSLTFIPTNDSSYLHLNGTPVLPDGTYVVDVAGKSAGATGFQAFNSGGGYLAGNMPNGDWTTTFTVGAGAAKDEVVWLPATAIGPGQALEAPGYTLSGGGEPIYLYDPSATPGQPGDVTSVTGTLTYNPSYLTVTSGMGGPFLTINVTSPGTATFNYSGPPVTFNNFNGLNVPNTGIASTPLGYLNWSGGLYQLSSSSLGSVQGAPGGTLTGGPSGTTYYYELASVANGIISPASTVVSVTLPAGDTGDSVLLYWPLDQVATGYNLYRTTTLVAGVPSFSTTNAVLLTNDIGYSADPTFGYQYLDTTANGSGTHPSAGQLPPAAASFAQATVPPGTTGTPLSIYQGKDVLTVSNVVVKTASMTLPSLGNSAVHLVAYVGDADGNGIYTSGGDAVELTRVHLQSDSGFPAYPLIDPVILGNVDNPDVGVFSGDAAFEISTLSVGSTPNFVAPKPNSVQVSPGGTAPFTIFPVGNGEDPTLTLPSNLQVGADGTVVVPVNIDDARPAGSTGLVEAELALTYNPSLFTVSASDVHAGSVLAGGTWSVVPSIDQATGQIGIVLWSSTPVSAATGGSLVIIDFHPVEASGGRQPPGDSGQAQFALAAYVTPNGQYFATELEDSQGAFTLTPAPTNSFDPRIDSVVTLPGTPAAALVSATPIAMELQAANLAVSSPAEPEMVDIALVPEAPVASASEPARQGTAEGPGVLAEAAPALPGAGAAHVVAAIGSFAGLQTAVPATGVVFLVANTTAAAAQGLASQHVADPFFQAVARGVANPTDPALGGLILSPADVDSLNWDAVDTDLDWQGAGDSLLRAFGKKGDSPLDLGGQSPFLPNALRRRERHDRNVSSTTTPVASEPYVADPAVLDQYFAQIAEDMDE